MIPFRAAVKGDSSFKEVLVLEIGIAVASVVIVDKETRYGEVISLPVNMLVLTKDQILKLENWR